MNESMITHHKDAESQNLGHRFTLSNYIGEVAARLGKPPVTENKKQQGDGGKVSEAGPIRSKAFEEDAAIASYQGGEGIQVNKRTVALGHNRFRIDYRCQIHPGHQDKRDSLRDVAQKYAERSY